MSIDADALVALSRAVTEIHDHIATPEGMAVWNRLNDADVALRCTTSEAEAERDALAVMLADCVAVLEQVPVALLPGRVDMMLISALDAPMHDVAATRTELITRAKAIRSKISEETARAGEAMRKRCLGLVQVEIDAVSRVEDDLIATGGENDSLSYAGHRASLQMMAAAIRALPLTEEATDAHR